MNTMSDDAKAIVLLCGRLGGESEAEPLQQREYNRLVGWLKDQKLRPADLLMQENVTAAVRGTGLLEKRLSSLIGRGVQLGFAIEKWNQSGIWVICRSDEDYPTRYKNHLKEKSPPVLFCTGERSLLNSGGLAIVGSRNVDTEGEAFTQNVAEWCAQGHMSVVSGGARGVDKIAMKAALEAGGCVIGIPADNLLKKSVSRDARYAIADGRLLLISPYHPDARFTVGAAMGRNKLIFAMADYGLVVSADYNRGGTWEGAKEELNRKSGRAVFVRLTGSVPSGNTKLAEQGAIRFPAVARDEDLATMLKSESDGSPREHSQEQDLFQYAGVVAKTSQVVEEEKPASPIETTERMPPAEREAAAKLYDAVLPEILSVLNEARTADELSHQLQVAKGQLQSWLKRAVTDNKVRKLSKPVRYIRRD